MDVGDLAPRRKDSPQNNCSGNLILAGRFRVGRFWFLKHASLRSDFFAAENFGVVTAAPTAAGTTATLAPVAATGIAAITWSITAAVAWANAATVTTADSVTGAWTR